ncbi:MAG TPA: adenine phosphoribosyltransferase [Elusimicrobiota bacterium]|nr:adenine phosphoribosyltransferase [Elusimicrobiota bacterium]
MPKKTDLKDFIRDIPDFPKKGILFKDVTPLLADAGAFQETVDRMAAALKGLPVKKVVAIESRGFIFGAAVAQKSGLGFVPVRKKGKLPAKTLSVTYDLEYGTDTLEMHADALAPGEKVAVVDDVLATGGTARAAAELVERAGAKPEILLFLIELKFLDGRKKLDGRPMKAILDY